MTKLMISAAALALAFSATTAFAQDEKTTTTTVTTPTSSTTTKTTESSDGYASYRKTVTSTRHYNAAAFVAPSGFVYHRFALGEHVPAAILSDQDLALADYGQYALAVPPSGLSWIRVGNDALLVDTSTGEVIQADYDLFAS